MTEENRILIEKSKQFAINCHRKVNQLYDGLPYYVHLQNVVDYVEKFKHLLTEEEYVLAVCGGWCHDSIEDGGITFNDVKKVLGEEIAHIAFLLTNHRGKNRSERANDDYYYGIKHHKIALFDKICDRLGNMTHSLLYGNRRMFDGYTDEFPHFKEHLYNGEFDEMWDFLQNIENISFVNEQYFPDITKFDEITIHQIHLPRTIPFLLYNELYSKGIIRKSDLVKNHYYQGKCRNADVALWNGFEFVYMRNKFGSTFPETIKHMEDDNGFDLFIALNQVTPTEQQRIKY